MKNIRSVLKDIFLFHPENPKEPFILKEPGEDSDEKRDNGQSRERKAREDDRSEKEENERDTKLEEEREPVRHKKQAQKKGRNGDSQKDHHTADGKEEKEEIKAPGHKASEEEERDDSSTRGKRDGKKGITQPVSLTAKEHPTKKKDDDDNTVNIHESLEVSLEKIKKIYTADINGDFVIREFRIRVKDKIYSAFTCSFDGMVNTSLVNTTILQPLMTLSVMPMDTEDQSLEEVVYNHLIPHNQIKKCKTYQEVVDQVNFGGIALFIDGLNLAFAGDVKGWEHRSVEQPTSELNIRGPKESFNEIIRSNTALLRKTLKDENLIVEDVQVGTRSKTPCSIAYIKNIANSSLVDEVRRRLKSIKVGYLQDSGELEQMLEDSTFLPAPQMLLTERPDRVAAYLAEGRVGIIVHGSPYVIIAPITLFNLLHSPEDYYLRVPYATLLRIVRIMGLLFTLLLPALYLAITNFHQEMLPTDLLLAIASSREKVPFPTLVSILIMEISFELIREAGIRIPGPIGTTLGIVGALILGQAAVSANLVSPILIIIVAITGIGSFAIPDFSLGYSFRALRFIYIILASMAGLLGIALCMFIHLLLLVHAHSFGVPFLVPFAPKTTGKRTNAVFKTPLWKEEDRPDYLNPKDVKKQPFISRGWVRDEKGVNSDEQEEENR